MRRVVPEIERFVERERGLRFKRPVKVELLDDKAFVKRLRGDGEQDVEALAKAEGFLQALHLIDGDVRLGDGHRPAAVLGRRRVLRPEVARRSSCGAASPPPSVRAILAHELTHALQDQHFDLERPALDERTDEAPQGFTGLVEGDAVRIQQRYFESLSADERAAFIAEEAAAAGPPGIPDVLVDAAALPVPAPARRSWTAILAAGGQARLDAAFAGPPETSEHLLHPEVYLRGEEARARDRAPGRRHRLRPGRRGRARPPAAVPATSARVGRARRPRAGAATATWPGAATAGPASAPASSWTPPTDTTELDRRPAPLGRRHDDVTVTALAPTAPSRSRPAPEGSHEQVALRRSSEWFGRPLCSAIDRFQSRHDCLVPVVPSRDRSTGFSRLRSSGQFHCTLACFCEFDRGRSAGDPDSRFDEIRRTSAIGQGDDRCATSERFQECEPERLGSDGRTVTHARPYRSACSSCRPTPICTIASRAGGRSGRDREVPDRPAQDSHSSRSTCFLRRIATASRSRWRFFRSSVKRAGIEQGGSIMPGRGRDESLEGDATSDDLCCAPPPFVHRLQPLPARDRCTSRRRFTTRSWSRLSGRLVPIPLEWNTREPSSPIETLGLLPSMLAAAASGTPSACQTSTLRGVIHSPA